MPFGNVFYDGQPQAAAIVGAAGNPIKALENPAHFRLRYTGTIINYRQARHRQAIEFDADIAALVAVGNGIIQQINQ